ncbi:MAG TPA: FlgD immunoglobulin-like domain containing protein [Candidatus Krumholzibacteria bacterium]|nr:FlgD immunoglobulin-like domain containing protein [Candidatus Krumholzibacteria bacterium]
MEPRYRSLVLIVIVCLATAAQAELGSPARLVRSSDGGDLIEGGAVGAAKSAVDTLLLMGPHDSGAPYVGDFQDAVGHPDWHGWTSVDATVNAVSHWQVSSYYAVSGSLSAWCGEDLPSCGGVDPEGGYGNNWNEALEWRGTVANTAQNCTVIVTANLRHDTEPGYDYTYLSCEKAGSGIVNVATWDGAGLEVVNETFTYLPGDYMGAGADEVVVLFRVTSDGGWSDGDCSWPTSGACQLDDVVITLSNGAGYAHDFEDGTLGDFTVRFPQGVGDFAQIWTNLGEIDPCVQNTSPQAAFIDDGIVVPGTGGSHCVNWCYGPGGFIVNVTGGLAGPDKHIDNYVQSPPMAWPDASLEGARLAFTVFRHEDLSADAPGMFYHWDVRSTDSGDPADLDRAGWMDRSFVYYGGPDYLEADYLVSDVLVPGRRYVQVRLGVYQFGWVWGWNGLDGYPAPYFDNVRFQVFPLGGPSLSARETELAEDAFPASGTIDPADPAALGVRFDMASTYDHSNNPTTVHGDSIVIWTDFGRNGAVMTGPPRMHWRLMPNAGFDAYRTAGLGTEGFVVCDTARWGSLVSPGRWSADLPDSGFLFPGDVLHYCFEASDAVGGDVRTSLLPADTTGFARFIGQSPYPAMFTVRALPSLRPDGYGGFEQPRWLVWNDGGRSSDDAAWHYALWSVLGDNSALGIDDHLPSFDLYTTNGPSSADGNGLGAAAALPQLAGYAGMLYGSGHQSTSLGAADAYTDVSPDLELLTAWLASGERGLILTGDHVAGGLGGSAAEAFRTGWMGVDFNGGLSSLIGGQQSPRVLVDVNPVLVGVASWYQYGGCPYPVLFDAVTARPDAWRCASYTDPYGVPDAYPYAALVAREDPVTGSRVLTLPCALAAVRTDTDEAAKYASNGSARERILQDLVNYCGGNGLNEWVGVPQAQDALAVACSPNPFNPRTEVRWAMGADGPLALKVYDVRGRLVRTLHDGPAAATGALAWDGRGDDGAEVASGLYFCEAQAQDERTVVKLTLIR